MSRKIWRIIVMAIVMTSVAVCLNACSGDEPEAEDIYNLAGSHWFGRTKVDIGSGLLNDSYPSQYAVTFGSDYTCIMEGSDRSIKNYFWKIPSTAEEKAYLPEGGVIINEYKSGGWKWLGEFEDENKLILRHALMGTGLTVTLTREVEEE